MLGRLLVLLSLWALVAALVGVSLCYRVLSLVTLAPSELAALKLLALMVVLLLAPPLEVVPKAVLAPPSELVPAPLPDRVILVVV